MANLAASRRDKILARTLPVYATVLPCVFPGSAMKCVAFTLQQGGCYGSAYSGGRICRRDVGRGGVQRSSEPRSKCERQRPLVRRPQSPELQHAGGFGRKRHRG